MNEKVTLPKEVAEAIEHYRGKGFSDAAIVSIAVTDGSMLGHAESLVAYVLEDFNNSDKLMFGLVNGYEVELTPQEQLRNYYAEVTEKYYVATNGTVEELCNKAELDAISKTLYILGIEIEGVNA
jgi:hypothetical protein